MKLVLQRLRSASSCPRNRQREPLLQDTLLDDGRAAKPISNACKKKNR